MVSEKRTGWNTFFETLVDWERYLALLEPRPVETSRQYLPALVACWRCVSSVFLNMAEDTFRGKATSNALAIQDQLIGCCLEENMASHRLGGMRPQVHMAINVLVEQIAELARTT